MKNICKNCGKEYEFEPKRGTYKFQYCSDKCKHEFAKKDALPQYRICEHCGKEYWWDGTQLRYEEGHTKVDTKRFCCLECGKAYSYTKAKKTQIERYGGVGWASESVKEKTKQTKKDRYGDVNYNNREKAKQTCLEKYGVESVSQTEFHKLHNKKAWQNFSPEKVEEITNKRKQTCLEKYGAENPSQVPEIQEKIKQTSIERYGVENYTKTEEYKFKAKQTCLEKYGTESYMQTEDGKQKIKNILNNKSEEEWQEIVEKRKQTSLEKYGVEFITQAPEIKEKIKVSNLERYGNEVAIQSEVIQNKIRTNNLEKYGTEFSIGSDEVQEKIRNTNLERHGYEYPFQSKELREIMEENRKKTNLERYGTENIIQVSEFKEKAEQTCLEKYGVPYNCMTKQCIEAGHNTISKINLKFKEKLDYYNIENSLEFCIEHQNYDFKCKNNILIEINPSFTHNSTTYTHLYKDVYIKPKDKYYHINKTKKAKEYGYRCIHLWDWDEQNKLINILKEKTILYARELLIKEVSQEDTDNLLNTYHFQNTCKGQILRFGLFKNNELIQIMTFGKSRYNTNYELELLRLCTKAEYRVVGGAEKLFKHFIKVCNPKSIISYCDNSKFSGDVYLRLGMKLKDYGLPRKHWYNYDTHKHITDALLLKYGYSALHNDKEHKKGESNEKLMLEAGYVEVYDCGQSTYVWISK